MYCRPPLVKSMSRSSLGGQTQVYTTVGEDEDERLHSTTTTQTRRDSDSKKHILLFKSSDYQLRIKSSIFCSLLSRSIFHI